MSLQNLLASCRRTILGKKLNVATKARTRLQSFRPALEQLDERILPSANLVPNSWLQPGQDIASPSGRFQLDMQSDGNLVLDAPWGALWSSSTAGQAGTNAVMQSDGNFVLYNGSKAVWNSGTWGHPGAYLTLQDDGNLVVYANGKALWNTGTFWAGGLPASSSSNLLPGVWLQPGQKITSPSGRFQLDMQKDGNLVLYAPWGGALWYSNTAGKTGISALVGLDGNLNLAIPGSGPVWTSGTNGHPGAYLTLQDDGNLVIYDATGKALWNTGTFWASKLPGPSSSNLLPGVWLQPGQKITSPSGRFQLDMQKDGNLNLFAPWGEIWSSNTAAGQTGISALVGLDGNFNLAIPGSGPVWTSGTSGHPGAYLTLQDDGNLVVCDATGKSLWGVDPPAHVSVIAPSTANAGVNFTVTVTATDNWGNRCIFGTLTLTSSDGFSQNLTLSSTGTATTSITDMNDTAHTLTLTANANGVIGTCSVAIPPLTSGVDEDGDGIDDGLEQSLAERYAPVIYIDPQELNYPVNVDWLLARAQLQYHQNNSFLKGDTDQTVTDPVQSQQNLFWQVTGTDITSYDPDPDNHYGDDKTWVLTKSAGISDESYKVGSLDPSQWVTYFHEYPNTGGGVTIQYWHVFSRNDIANDLGKGTHEGDWDASIQVVLGANLKPTGVWYSRHEDDKPGDLFGWNDVHVYQGTHPIVMTDAGGHAAFKDMGDWKAYYDSHKGSLLWMPIDLRSWSAVHWRDDPDGPGDGTVWKTWTGGTVVQNTKDSPAHLISPNGGYSGGLVNVGEYNPGIDQACQLLSGQFRPLNGQIFTKYSGHWGALGGWNPPGPRGPVFQGWNDLTSTYTSWYNGGANVPANATDDIWRRPPTTSLSGLSSLVLTTQQNPVAQTFGRPIVYYRVFDRTQRGGPTPSFTQYAGPIQLSGPDGTYQVEFYSVDSLGNVESYHSQYFTLDNSAPKIAINQFSSVQYVHSSSVTLAYNVADLGSGMAPISPLLDGGATLASHGLASGLKISQFKPAAPKLKQSVFDPESTTNEFESVISNSLTRVLERTT